MLAMYADVIRARRLGRCPGYRPTSLSDVDLLFDPGSMSICYKTCTVALAPIESLSWHDGLPQAGRAPIAPNSLPMSRAPSFDFDMYQDPVKAMSRGAHAASTRNAGYFLFARGTRLLDSGPRFAEATHIMTLRRSFSGARALVRPTLPKERATRTDSHGCAKPSLPASALHFLNSDVPSEAVVARSHAILHHELIDGLGVVRPAISAPQSAVPMPVSFLGRLKVGIWTASAISIAGYTRF